MVMLHTLRGNQSRWVLTVTGLLILFDVMVIANNYFVILWYSGHDTKAVMNGNILCFTIGGLAFNLSHAMLAEKYASAKRRAVNTLEQ
jgi:hypothetical protein